jgi:hypothetical protein
MFVSGAGQVTIALHDIDPERLMCDDLIEAHGALMPQGIRNDR